MQFNLDMDTSSYAIRAYRPGEITISVPLNREPGVAALAEIASISGSLILSPGKLIRDWAPLHVTELLTAHLEAVADLQPEVILLGTGPRLEFPASEILAVLHERQIGVEVMDTAAACRTYNILMAEGRNVVAGLINPLP